jgi:SAM-dependent methyltransferase
LKREFAEQYSSLEVWHWWFRGRRRILEAALHRQLSGHRSRSIASVGCGPPEGIAWLADFAGPDGRVVGLDAEPARGCSSVEYVVGKLEAAPVRARSFDVVLALDVLEHLDDDAAGLAEGARMLKPDGLLLVTVPALPSLWGSQDIVSHHRRRYTRDSLYQTFARAGLPRPDVTYFNSLLFPPIAAIRALRRMFGQADESRSDFDDNRPGFTNEILASIFASERHMIGRLRLPIGVSLLAHVRMK